MVGELRPHKNVLGSQFLFAMRHAFSNNGFNSYAYGCRHFAHVHMYVYYFYSIIEFRKAYRLASSITLDVP